jgi:hypothetical protein
LNKCDHSLLVEHLCGFPIQIVTKAVGVVFHPCEQGPRCLVRVRSRGLASLDPPLEEIIHQHTEAATGVIDLLGLLVAGGDEDLEETCRALRLLFHDLVYLARYLFNLVDKGPCCIVGDEAPGVEDQLDGLLERINLLAFFGVLFARHLFWSFRVIIGFL